MKTTIKLVLVITAVALCSNISAQNLKLAHINIQELVGAMPEYDSATVKLQKYAKDLESDLDAIRLELNRKYEDYNKNSAGLTDIVLQSRQQELVAMQQRVAAFQEQAQESYSTENEKLMQPVIEKANKAIETVAKEQGVTYVLNAQVLHFKAVGTLDLLPAVKQHLGIKN